MNHIQSWAIVKYYKKIQHLYSKLINITVKYTVSLKYDVCIYADRPAHLFFSRRHWQLCSLANSWPTGGRRPTLNPGKEQQGSCDNVNNTCSLYIQMSVVTCMHTCTWSLVMSIVKWVYILAILILPQY